MQKLVVLSKILSDTNRIQMLLLLEREKELCVCEICDTLKLSQPLVSRHLRQMRGANIVTSAQKGKYKTYRLTPNETLLYLLRNIQKEDKELPPLIKCSK